MAVAMALERRIVLSALAFALAFVSHPILGLLGGIFGAAVLLMDWRRIQLHSAVYASLLFAVVAGGWFMFIASSGTLSGGGIPDALYVAITRIESSHWYPVDQALFWERHWERLFPFLGMTLLLLVYLPNAEGEFRGRAARLAAGFAAMLALTAVGICISMWVREPFLIKLALQRASSIYLLFALFCVVPGLWRDAATGTVWRAGIATLVFVSSFICSYGVPIAFGIALAGVAIAEDLRNYSWTTRARLLTATAAMLAILLAVYAFGGVVDWSNQQYWGLTSLSAVRLGLVIGLVAFVILTRRRPALPAAGLLAAIAVLGALWARSTDLYTRQPALLAEAKDYLAAQLWSEKNTPVGALFMPDPTHYYGWREFSLRPSFGNLREWLYNGWAYNSRKAVLDEGIARLDALGIDLNRYLRVRTNHPGDVQQRMSNDLRQRYYALTGKDLAALSRKFGISYFVFDRNLRRSAPQDYPIVYENDHYLIVRAPGHP